MAFVQPASKLEQDIFDVWKEVYPIAGFTLGLSELAGKVFIPTGENLTRMTKRIRELKVQVPEGDRVMLKFLNDIDLDLQFSEPFLPALGLVGGVPAYLAKEGFNAKHLQQLAEGFLKVFGSFKPLTKKEWPIEIRVMTIAECNGALELIKVLKKNVRDSKARNSFDALARAITSYKKAFAVTGVKKGNFAEVFPIIKRSKNTLSRQKIYAWCLKDFYDFLETPEEIERKAIVWIMEEKPLLDEAVRKLAKVYKTKPNQEAVDKAIENRYKIKPSRAMEIIQSLRKKARPVFEKQFIRVTPNYDTRILPVPGYLDFFFPSAGMMNIDTLTDKPFNLFFVSTNPKFDPPTTIPAMMNLIVHEEYGHCVNFSNSATGFAAKPTLLEMIPVHLATPITEGLSFHWELLALQLFQKLFAKPKGDLSKEEAAFLNELSKYGTQDVFLLEFEFYTRKWRFIRFLRALCDVRVNTGTQSFARFIEWAYKETGVSKKEIFQQNIHFQEMPGYAPCYSVFGQSLRAIQDKALAAGTDFVEFNTCVSSMGFPCRGVFESRLKRKYLEQPEMA
ncbi:hypothetical protein HY546_02155 [archaeon]|nr:hypothetical protein [archaeon]